MKGMHLKSEIAQLELSDLGREDHARRKPSVTLTVRITKRLRPAVSAALLLEDLIRSAERVGFEPTVGQDPQRFSRPPHSAALAPLQFNSCQVFTCHRDVHWHVTLARCVL